MTGTLSLILLGKILAPHGVRGQVKVASYAEHPENLVAYGPLSDKSGTRHFKLKLQGQATQGALIASINGITNRDQAETVRNIELYIPRDKLPAAKAGEYYQTDLIGLPVYKEDGILFGTLQTFHNFGAGTLAEIRFADGKTDLFAFTEKIFLRIDPAQRTIIISPPEIVEK